MNILVLTGSPHTNGTTAFMTESFINSLDQSHEVTKFDAGRLEIKPCIACGYCRKFEDTCAYKDAMQDIYPALLAADLVVFVTPLYYFGMTAQLKHTIDRFFAINQKLRVPKKAMLLAACGDADSWAMDALSLHFKTICRYLKWDYTAEILAFDCYTKEMIEKSAYPEQVKKLAASL